MKDYIVLVDTPNGEARASAVLAKAKEMIPGKPIRYVVAMHHHWDHMGGIRTAIDEGATIVTHESNRALLERPAVAFCGARDASEGGLGATQAGAALLAAEGVNVVSGYASGVDLTAHVAALAEPAEQSR